MQIVLQVQSALNNCVIFSLISSNLLLLGLFSSTKEIIFLISLFRNYFYNTIILRTVTDRICYCFNKNKTKISLLSLNNLTFSKLNLMYHSHTFFYHISPILRLNKTYKHFSLYQSNIS